MKNLFEEFKIRDITVKNRICLPPLVCFGYAKEGGFVGEKNISHYTEMAKGGFGAIVVEATAISANGRLSKDQLGIWDDAHIDGHRSIVNVIHAENTPAFLQIHHAGLIAVGEDVVSASPCTEKNRTARGLSFEEVVEIEDAYVSAAIRAEKAGYDGVELHGAHNYLLTQFLNKRVNQRDDAYGEDETLIVKNILSKIRAKVSEKFVVGIRMGCFEPTLEDGIRHGKIFEEIGIDFLNVSSGFSLRADAFAPSDFPFADVIYGAGEIKKGVNVPVFAVYGIKSRDDAERVTELTNVDMVCIGRGALVNPNWPNDAKDDNNVGKCVQCPTCFWHEGRGSDCPGRKLLSRQKNA